MITIRKTLTVLLAVLLAVLPGMGVLAESTSVGTEEFRQGAFASQGSRYVYFYVTNNTSTGLYAVPVKGGTFSLVELDESIRDLVAVDTVLYYLRSIDGQWELARREGGSVTILQAFPSGSQVHDLGYIDGQLYLINNGWLFRYDAVTGEEKMVTEEQMDSYCLLGDRIYYVSAVDQRAYQRSLSDGSGTTGVTAGCLYSMRTDGTDVQQVLDLGVSDLRGCGEDLYFYNYSDNYFVSNASDGKMWLDGRLYRYSTRTGSCQKAYDSYDWDFYPTRYGLVIYSQMSLDLYSGREATGTLLMAPEVYTSIASDGVNVLVYEYSSQALTRVPLDGSVAVLLGTTLPDPAVGDADTKVTLGSYVDEKNLPDVDKPKKVQTTENDKNGTGSTQSTTAKRKTTINGYIFPESDSRKLTTTDLKQVDARLWAYGRNEIYARHGYKFHTEKMATYFAKRNWYKTGDFDADDLNYYEWYNIMFIKQYEDRYKDEIAQLNAGK